MARKTKEVSPDQKRQVLWSHFYSIVFELTFYKLELEEVD
jgi:hypothetical protein